MAKKNPNFDRIIEFMKETEKFKLVERKIPLSSLKRYENDAEHSWHLAMFVMLLQNELPKNLDTSRMIKLALVHDLGELYVGDVSFFDTAARNGKEKRELNAAKKLFSKLPRHLEKEMMALFIEYSEGKTREAKCVKSLDKLQATIQNISSKSTHMKKMGITAKMVDEKKRPYMTHNEKILALHERIMHEAVGSNLFAKD